MKKTYLRRALICGLALSTMGYTNAFAEEAEQAAADDLGEVVVTAERMSSKKLDTPANVVVISDKEIADNHYSDLAEALENVNGVTVNQVGNGNKSYVTINGDERVVLLVDGQRLNNDMGSTFGRASVELEMIPTLDNVQRIEVVKGGASALYGSDAVGGVINVITKKNYDNKTTIDVSAGSFATTDIKVMNQGNQDGLDWFVAGVKHHDGDFDYKDRNGNSQTMKNADGDKQSAVVKLRKSLSDSESISLGVNYNQADTNVPNSVHLDAKYTNVNLTYNFKEDTVAPGFVRIFYNNRSMEDYSEYTSRSQGIDFQDGWKLNDQHTLIAGAEYHWSNSSNADGGGYSGETVKSQALYLQDQYAFADKWLFIPGIRIDHHSEFGTHWSPKLALNYKADDNTNFYANWGKVFKAPTTDDMFYYQNWGAPYIYIGNPNLRPESGWTATLGMNHRFDKKNSMDLSFFKSDLTDAIDWAPAAGAFYATNIDKEKKQGMEINFKSKLTDNWTVNAGYSYTHREYNSNFDANNPQPNGYRLGVAYKNRDFKANLHGVMANGLSTSTFAESRTAVFNFNTSYVVNESISVYAKVLNLTNQHYTLGSENYPAPGRFFQIGATYSF